MNRIHRMQSDHAHLDLLLTCNLIMCVLTICHMKLMQSTALEQKCFDLRLLSPALHLWLLLVQYGVSNFEQLLDEAECDLKNHGGRGGCS